MRTAALLKKHNLLPKKSLGQNFLIDESALGRIAAAADLVRSDTVLEIGAGLGALTHHLAAAADRVIAVELDERLVAILNEEFHAIPSVEIVHGDILALDPADLAGGPYKVVANVPYYITAAILRHLLEASRRPDLIVLTVQKEVAQRLTAGPGDMSILAVSVQLYGRVEQVAQIKAGSFLPRPEVDSAVIRVTLYPEPLIPLPDERLFFRIVRAGFGQKRKQLRNSLRGGLNWPAERTERALERAGVSPKRRAETLSLEEWGALTQAVAELDSQATAE